MRVVTSSSLLKMVFEQIDICSEETGSYPDEIRVYNTHELDDLTVALYTDVFDGRRAVKHIFSRFELIECKSINYFIALTVEDMFNKLFSGGTSNGT